MADERDLKHFAEMANENKPKFKQHYTMIKFEPNEELLAFAESFSENWNIVDVGDYISPGGKYHIKYVDRINEGEIEKVEDIAIELSGLIVISRLKLEGQETNADYVFYQILWCIVEQDMQDKEKSDIATMEYYMTTGRPIKNVIFSILSALPNSLENHNRIEALIKFIKAKLPNKVKSIK